MRPLEVFGDGSEEVYAYSFPSSVAGDRWPCKIGKSKSNSIKRIVNQQASMHERPIVWLVIKTENCSILESEIHCSLSDHRLPLFGSEWFQTNPDEIMIAAKNRKFKPDSLGDAVRFSRYERGLSQMKLSELSGLRQATISAVESGHDVMASTVVRLLSAMGKRIEVVDD